MVGSMVYRLRVGPPDSEPMQRFRQAMDKAQAISDQRGYNWIAGFHGVPAWDCWHHQQNRHNPRVRARLFLPWHRAYLWWLEQAMQDQVSGAALPWWDWTLDRDIPQAYAPAAGGRRNVLAASRISLPQIDPPVDRFTTRDAGGDPRVKLPTAREIQDLLAFPDWGSFSDQLEIYHDQVHDWVGGDMGQLDFAAYDPIFFAHHCMIDRIWYLWQVKNGANNITPGLLDMELPPFGKRVSDVIDIETMGYDYAVSAKTIDVSEVAHG